MFSTMPVASASKSICCVMDAIDAKTECNKITLENCDWNFLFPWKWKKKKKETPTKRYTDHTVISVPHPRLQAISLVQIHTRCRTRTQIIFDFKFIVLLLFVFSVFPSASRPLENGIGFSFAHATHFKTKLVHRVAYWPFNMVSSPCRRPHRIERERKNGCRKSKTID